MYTLKISFKNACAERFFLMALLLVYGLIFFLSFFYKRPGFIKKLYKFLSHIYDHIKSTILVIYMTKMHYQIQICGHIIIN